MKIREFITKLFVYATRIPSPILAILCLASTLVFIDDAWGRAGGGGGFGGGGGGRSGGSFGGSSGGGGGGDALIFYFLVKLVIDHPLIGIPLLIFIGYVFYKGSKQANEARNSGTLRKGTMRNVRAAHDNAVNNITKHDPNFSMEIFSNRVNNAFIKAQDSWCAQEIIQIRPFVTDGIYERWTLQLDEQKKSGVRDQMSNINIENILLDNYEICGGTEELTVRITATAIDYQIRLDNGKRLSGNNSPERFTEYWTFLRRKGTKTLQNKDGLMEGNCPNCGAAVGINASAKCEHCGALLRSGEYDWVLSEITQESVYTVNSSTRLPGILEIQHDDPELSPRMIEDRASVIFWRWVFSLQEQKTSACGGCCTPDFIESMNKYIKERPGKCYINCAVGAVDLLGIIPAEDFNQAIVEVTWSGERATKNSKGSHKDSEKCIMRQLFVLMRKTGVKSIKSNGVGSAHCPNCGAPENVSDGGKCSYCGFLLNDGSTQWVLLDKYSRNTNAGHEIIAQLREAITGNNSNDNELDNTDAAAGFNMSAYALMAWLCNLAASDGDISESEVNALQTAARARNLPVDIINHMLQAAKSGNLEAPEPENIQEAKTWLQALARMALADGKVTREERQLMLAAGKKLNFKEIDIDLIIKRERSKMLQKIRNNK